MRAKVLVGITLLTIGCSNPEYAKQEYLKSGDRYAADKKYSEAVVQYRNAIQQDPRFGEARLKLADTYEKLNDPQNALREYVQHRSRNVTAQEGAGCLFLASIGTPGRERKALAKDENVDAQIILGNSLAGLNNRPMPSELEEAVQLDPVGGGLCRLGTAMGRRPAAEAAFRKAVETNPSSSLVHVALANFLISSGRRAEAEPSLRKAVELAPTSILANRALAAYYLGMRRAPEAEPYLKAIADADTTPNAPGKLALADYYIAMNRVHDGMRVLEELATKDGARSAAPTRVAVIDYQRTGAAAGNRHVASRSLARL